MKEINLLSILEEKCSNKAFLTQNEKEFVFYAMKEACLFARNKFILENNLTNKLS